ncbi:ESX secretion-associated protein EspG [Amycolatopsis cihanbeyliensis]|uniref:ESAT-6 protein secretion system EspG family protein n=1 Tax=Amycolatopsis cihanbeyliensis TaxID=1128664 RepID=A0A542DMF3_AMYCI|nr:ESX secretion-associated protein EspG [Amycolatopsis cihanbeyliensis]TQJ04266.1 ESAT-6 protein secretion system EspG family protein [Amycolatopsis cihanbeyliensis]
MRDPDSGWIQLYPGEFFLLWSELGLGDPPPTLGIRQIGRTAAARARLIEGASGTLAERDLGTVTEPARDLAGLLRQLGESELRVDLEVERADFAFRAVAASGRRGAVTAGFAGAELRIGPVRPANLVPTMLEVLTPLDAGVGSPANVRVGDYTRACAEGERGGTDGFIGVLRDAGVRPPEVNTLVRAVARRAGGGQLGGSVRTGAGRWVRAPSPVGWVDTEEGRFALRRNGDWVTVTPVDLPRLHAMAEELVADLAG